MHILLDIAIAVAIGLLPFIVGGVGILIAIALIVWDAHHDDI